MKWQKVGNFTFYCSQGAPQGHLYLQDGFAKADIDGWQLHPAAIAVPHICSSDQNLHFFKWSKLKPESESKDHTNNSFGGLKNIEAQNNQMMTRTMKTTRTTIINTAVHQAYQRWFKVQQYQG
jgi:hypothetical protein